MEEDSLCQALDENVAGNWDSEEEFRLVRPGDRCKANVKLCTLAFIKNKLEGGDEHCLRDRSPRPKLLSHFFQPLSYVELAVS